MKIDSNNKSGLIIVAHPDDETLWAGGMILSHPKVNWLVLSLCRKNDTDRAPKFSKTMIQLHAEGLMGDLDDGPGQNPLELVEVEEVILGLLTSTAFDIIITHAPQGEYTRHLRHEETSNAVLNLWEAGKLQTSTMLLFAYSDNQKTTYPKAIESASLYNPLTPDIWKEKYSIIIDTYGFGPDSWEAKTTPTTEAFWQFKSPSDAREWLKNYTQQL